MPISELDPSAQSQFTLSQLSESISVEIPLSVIFVPEKPERSNVIAVGLLRSVTELSDTANSAPEPDANPILSSSALSSIGLNASVTDVISTSRFLNATELEVRLWPRYRFPSIQ